MGQVSDREQGKPEYSTPQIDVMANTLWETPLHRREQMKRLGDMCNDDHHQKPRAEELEES